MRMGMRMATVLAIALPGMACGAEPAPAIGVGAPAAPKPSGEFRLKRMTAPTDPQLQVDAPQSIVRTGFGGSMMDLFPIAGEKLHISAGGRLFGRAGRPRASDPESMRYLPAFRGGFGRGGRRFSPAMLVGYGRTVDRGLALGVDAGVVMGKVGATPDRLGRLNRRRLESVDGRGRQTPMNEIARVTALYRF